VFAYPAAGSAGLYAAGAGPDERDSVDAQNTEERDLGVNISDGGDHKAHPLTTVADTANGDQVGERCLAGVH
jgi:hypothetical protein